MKRLIARRRVIMAFVAAALLAGGGAWWYFSPRLTDEEKQFVGRWTWPVTYPNPPYKTPPHPPGTLQVIDILPDRTIRFALFLPDGTQSGKTIGGRWRVADGELVITHWSVSTGGLRALWERPPNGMEAHHPHRGRRTRPNRTPPQRKPPPLLWRYAARPHPRRPRPGPLGRPRHEK